MRFALITLVVLAVLALPAAAATVDPKQLVLAPTDVPAGFRLDRAETGVRTNELEAKEYPETRARFRRWGRVIGYQASYRGRDASGIEARADLFRDAGGAQELHNWAVGEYRKTGSAWLRQSRAGVGAESVVFWSAEKSGAAVVLWRYGRVWSGMAGIGLGKERTLALARAQQRRIAGVLG